MTREEAIKIIERVDICANAAETARDMAIAALQEPEVVHGRWEKHWCDNSMIGHEFEECSECGCSMLDTNQFWDSNYCPNCGAKMDGGKDE